MRDRPRWSILLLERLCRLRSNVSHSVGPARHRRSLVQRLDGHLDHQLIRRQPEHRLECRQCAKILSRKTASAREFSLERVFLVLVRPELALCKLPPSPLIGHFGKERVELRPRNRGQGRSAFLGRGKPRSGRSASR